MEALSRRRLPLQLERTPTVAHRQAGRLSCLEVCSAAGSHLSQILSHQAKQALLPGTQEKSRFYKGRRQNQDVNVSETI